MCGFDNDVLLRDRGVNSVLGFVEFSLEDRTVLVLLISRCSSLVFFFKQFAEVPLKVVKIFRESPLVSRSSADVP